MARRVFFSFHYASDSWLVSQVRNAYRVAQGDSQPLLDWAEWEKIEKAGSPAIRRWIDEQMNGASVVVVLYGAQTYTRPWVKYEIQKALGDGRGLLGVSLQGMTRQNGLPDNRPCPSPFVDLTMPNALYRPPRIPTYSWVQQNGRQNLATWVETAAKAAGR